MIEALVKINNFATPGELPERPNGAVSKTVVRASEPRVRIPDSPLPSKTHNLALLAKSNENISESPSSRLREQQWKEQFTKIDGTWFCVVIEKPNGELIGFAKGKKHDTTEYRGDLNKIYLLRDYQRLGLGSKLISMVAERFIGMGIHSMILFGDAGNPSIAFHEAMGGKRLIGSNGEFTGNFGWKNIGHLVKREK